jgi:HSP20 family protein
MIPGHMQGAATSTKQYKASNALLKCRSPYFFHDFAALDHFFDEAFISYAHRQLRNQNQVSDAFRPRLEGSFSEKCFLTHVRRMDVHQNKDTNIVTASFDLPGLRKEDVAIDLLTVSGESKSTSERSEDEYPIRERRYGKFVRSLSLPQGVKVRRLFWALNRAGY